MREATNEENVFDLILAVKKVQVTRLRCVMSPTVCIYQVSLTSQNIFNKANLRDLIVDTGLVTLFGLCDIESG